jgi:hypothetical protein
VRQFTHARALRYDDAGRSDAPRFDKYSSVSHIDVDESQLLELLAQEAWSDVRLAKPYVEAIGPWKAA